ncbi:hypothetical protein [Streptomyces roseicoloratus]|uniref:Lipoprotein n=1 Tax=Streptomyces roseicoloratus TaxID=2508722 RepID=A0ABY9RYI5_9ACTN|nr:hypothetical protein [Streptomyces roseicoloratus]WMX47245.1 hypothetical protein RGF97_23860 [Streptomyces roseicoloratus]
MREVTWIRRTAAVLCLPALAACGIQGSDVVEAGGAATVAVEPTGGTKLMLYFVGEDGQLMPVTRSLGLAVGPSSDLSLIDDNGRVLVPHYEIDGPGDYRIATDTVLRTLLEGPDEEERAAGLTTRLNLHGAGEPHVRREQFRDGRPALSIRLATRVQDFDTVAHQQLVCTAAYAEGYGGAATVLVTGTDGALPETRCEA